MCLGWVIDHHEGNSNGFAFPSIFLSGCWRNTSWVACAALAIDGWRSPEPNRRWPPITFLPKPQSVVHEARPTAYPMDEQTDKQRLNEQEQQLQCGMYLDVTCSHFTHQDLGQMMVWQDPWGLHMQNLACPTSKIVVPRALEERCQWYEWPQWEPAMQPGNFVASSLHLHAHSPAHQITPPFGIIANPTGTSAVTQKGTCCHQSSLTSFCIRVCMRAGWTTCDPRMLMMMMIMVSKQLSSCVRQEQTSKRQISQHNSKVTNISPAKECTKAAVTSWTAAVPRTCRVFQ